MATCLFSEVDRDMPEQGWVVERPFLPLYVGDGHFVVQMRPKGEPFDEMYSILTETMEDMKSRREH